jgi:hypothetical protein
MSTPTPVFDQALESCHALIIGLGPRRWVIVRRDGPQPIQALSPPRKRLRDLQVGDEILCNGQREIVRSLAVYA